MDIKRTLCEHKDRAYKMQWFDKREKGKFIPLTWMCRDCGQMQKD